MKRISASDSAMPIPCTRRSILRLTAFAAVAGLLEPLLSSPVAKAAGPAEALLLSCMDFRLMDDIEHYMSGRGLREKYDHVVLAGASLGALTTKYPAWNKTFWQHLDIALELHHIHKVIVMDHRDCGAYKVILGEDFGAKPAKESEVHAKQLRALAKRIHGKYPALEVELLLMSLDGSVEAVVEAA